MLTVHEELIFKMGENLVDKEKIMLTMISKQMDALKHKFIYIQKIKINKIIGLSYFDNFECIEVLSSTTICPKAAKLIYLYTATQQFPPFVTHLTYDRNQRVNNIPLSVTHLTLGGNSMRPAQGRGFNQPIQNCIPSSVTHLTFGSDFDQPINDFIPHSVTHIKFGCYFNQSINDLHDTVEEIILHSVYIKRIDTKFVSKISILTQ